MHEGSLDCVLDAVFGQVPVAGEPDEARDHAGPFRCHDRGDRLGRGAVRMGGHSSSVQNGRSSSLPPLAWGCRAAIAMASSRLSHSRMSKPAIHSFDSVKGPSVTSTCPRLTLTVVASLTGRRASPVMRFPRPLTSASHSSIVSSPSDGSASAAASGSATTNIMYLMVSHSWLDDADEDTTIGESPDPTARADRGPRLLRLPQPACPRRRHGTHRRAARGMREAGREGRSLESGEPVGDFRVGTWRGRALGDLTPFPDRPPPLTWARASDRPDIIGSLDGLSALFTSPDAHDLLVNPRQRSSLRPRYEVIQQELSGSERTP